MRSPRLTSNCDLCHRKLGPLAQLRGRFRAAPLHFVSHPIGSEEKMVLARWLCPGCERLVRARGEAPNAAAEGPEEAGGP